MLLALPVCRCLTPGHAISRRLVLMVFYDLVYKGFQGLANLACIRASGSVPAHDHEIQPDQLVLAEPEHLSGRPLEPVSAHRFFDTFFGDGQTQSRSAGSVNFF